MACHIAICDDNPADIRYLSGILERWARERGILLHVDSFPSAEAFLFCYAERKDFDILLLDIEMASMDGVTLARTIRRENENIQIVFITGYSDYIAEGYDVSALHYLMKPVRFPWAYRSWTCAPSSATSSTMPLKPAWSCRRKNG